MPGDRGARIAILAASGLAHVGVLTLLALPRSPLPVAAPPPVMHVDLVAPYVRPPPPRAARPTVTPRRDLRPHAARTGGEVAPLAPLMLPRPPPTRAEGLNEEVRAALRDGAFGCANAEALGLDRRARDRCGERLGDGARSAPFRPAALDREVRTDFDRAAARKAADRRYREAPIPPGLSTSDAAGGITGLGETGHGKVPFP